MNDAEFVLTYLCLIQPFEGETCSEVTYCSGHLCGDNGTCVPRFESRDYTCVCDLGWTGPYCNQCEYWQI